MTDIEKQLIEKLNQLGDYVFELHDLFKQYIDEKFKELEGRFESHVEHGGHDEGWYTDYC